MRSLVGKTSGEARSLSLDAVNQANKNMLVHLLTACIQTFHLSV